MGSLLGLGYKGAEYAKIVIDFDSEWPGASQAPRGARIY